MKKNNRQWKQALAIVGLTLMCVLMTGCGDDEPAPAAETGQARLRITAESINAGRTRADAPVTDPGTTEERSYNVLHLYYMVAPDGVQLAHQQVAATGAFPLDVDVPKAVSDYNGAVDIFVFASPTPAAGTMPDTATRADLQALTTSGMTTAITAGSGQLTYPNGTDRCIPMSGSIAAHNFKNQHFAELLLRRAVAKFRIRVQNDITPTTGTTIDLLTDRMTLKLANLRAQSPLQPLADGTYTPGSIGTFASQTFNAAATAGAATAFVPQTTTDTDGKTVTWLHTAYANEHLFDVSAGATPPTNCGMMEINLPYTIKKNGVLTTTEENNLYSIPLDFPLKRNFIYQITVHVYGFGKKDVKIEVKVLPWNIETALPGESGRGFDLKGQVGNNVYIGIDTNIGYTTTLKLRSLGLLITGSDAVSDLELSCTSSRVSWKEITTGGQKDIELAVTFSDPTTIITSATILEDAVLTVRSKSNPKYFKSINLHFDRTYVGGVVWLDRNLSEKNVFYSIDPLSISGYQPGMLSPRPARRRADTPQAYTKGNTPCPKGYTVPTNAQWTAFFTSISPSFYFPPVGNVGKYVSEKHGDYEIWTCAIDGGFVVYNTIDQQSTKQSMLFALSGFATETLPISNLDYPKIEIGKFGYYLTMEGDYVRVGMGSSNAFKIVPFATYAADVRYANIRCIKETD